MALRHVLPASGLAAVVAVLAISVGGGASALAAQADDHEQYARADVEYGLRLYSANCAVCHGENGDAVGSVNLRSGRFRRASSDRDLQRIFTEGLEGTAMPPGDYDAAERTALVAYLRRMGDFDPSTVTPGDAARGRAVFGGKGGCTTCHRVNGAGSRAAPDLSDIGAVRPAGALERSLVDPTSAMMPINRPVRIVTDDGRVVRGRRLNEDTHTVQVIDAEAGLVSFEKARLREYEILTTSPMPSYRDRLAPEELADLLAYLLSLKDVSP